MKSIKNYEDVKSRSSDWEAWEHLINDASMGPVNMPAPGYDEATDAPTYHAELGMFEASPTQVAASFHWPEDRAVRFLERLIKRGMIELTGLRCEDGSPVAKIVGFPNPLLPVDYIEWEA